MQRIARTAALISLTVSVFCSAITIAQTQSDIRFVTATRSGHESSPHATFSFQSQLIKGNDFAEKTQQPMRLLIVERGTYGTAKLAFQKERQKPCGLRVAR